MVILARKPGKYASSEFERSLASGDCDINVALTGLMRHLCGTEAVVLYPLLQP